TTNSRHEVMTGNEYRIDCITDTDVEREVGAPAVTRALGKGCLGFGHNSPILSPQLIPELCNQNIQYFVNGKHTLALTGDGRVYAWGCNDFGQIGCGNKSDCNSCDGIYKHLFIEMSTIGSGGFGTVFKVKHRLDDKIYAVKRVQFGDLNEDKKQKAVKEVKSLAKIDSEFVVKYYNSWLEFNHLYIQTEFCSQSFKSVLKDKAIVFERQTEDLMNIFEYFISCEIFKELLECVQYLHESNPPVIHRDLKPDNILIDPIYSSNRCVKLCDFGLATDHDIDGHTASRYEHSVCGALGYMAPEVLLGKQYDHKSDIYSLYVIGEQLFGIDLQASQTFETNESVVTTAILCMCRTLQKMMAIVW
ncbi:unnamed protein product, partial [Medioppia subpectinata]